MRHTIALSLLLGSALGLAASVSFAQTTNIQAPSGKSAYLQDERGPIVRSQDGLCWRSGYWEQNDAVTGCDGALVPPVMKASAPALVADPMTSSNEAPPAVVASCDFSVTLASDETFSFGKAILSAAARQRIDQQVVAKLKNCNNGNVILITGHTDNIGSEKYNQKLSKQRAANVASYLKSKGVSNKMETAGAGASDPIVNCKNDLGRKQRINCLSPNRRVVIKTQLN